MLSDSRLQQTFKTNAQPTGLTHYWTTILVREGPKKKKKKICFSFTGTHIVDHEVHDGLRHEIADGLVDDAHVGVDQVADGFHLPLQLGVHGVHEAV